MLLLQLNQAGVNSSVKEFRIEYDLGKDGATRVDRLDGDLSAKDVVNDVYIETLASGCFKPGTLSANLYITGQGPHAGSIDIETFQDPTKLISIAGTIAGDINLGNWG